MVMSNVNYLAGKNCLFLSQNFLPVASTASQMVVLRFFSIWENPLKRDFCKIGSIGYLSGYPVL